MNDNICKYLYTFFFVIACFQCQQASSSSSCHASVFTPGILFLISHSSWRISAVIIVWHFTNANRKWVSSRNAEGWEVSSRWTVWLFYEISNSFSELKWEEKQHFIVIKSGFRLWSQKAHAPRLLAGRACVGHGSSLNFGFFLCEMGMLNLAGFLWEFDERMHAKCSVPGLTHGKNPINGSSSWDHPMQCRCWG